MKPDLYLASASPRRKQLLEQLGLRFEVAAADVDETPLAGEAPVDYVMRLARAKAEAAAHRLGNPAAPVLAADTAVKTGSPCWPGSRAAAIKYYRQ